MVAPFVTPYKILTQPPPREGPPPPKGKILFCGPILTKFGMVIPLATYFKILPQSPSPVGPPPTQKGKFRYVDQS